MNIPRVIFFDLDNTLVDHTSGLVDALRRVCDHAPSLTLRSGFDEVCRIYEAINDELWSDLAAGRTTAAELRVERFRRLLGEFPDSSDGRSEPALLSELYMREYVRVVRPFEGIVDLLTRLRRRHTLGVISNGFAETQRAKLSACGLDTVITHQIYSEEVGAFKPDPAIFRAALSVADASPRDALYVGDNFDIDVAGASRVGMATIWFNSVGVDRPHDALDVEPLVVAGSIAELSRMLEGAMVAEQWK